MVSRKKESGILFLGIVSVIAMFVFVFPALMRDATVRAVRDREQKLTHEKQPRIVSKKKMKLPNCADDPLGCDAEEIVVLNPRLRVVVVTVTCGAENGEADLVIYPRTRQTFQLELDVPGGTCEIKRWKEPDPHSNREL